MFSTEEYERYSRHLLLPEVGEAGQNKLKNASVCIVGAGGLGSPALYYLAAAGIGRLGIVDFDTVDRTNLHRQILHATPDIGRPKLDSAHEKLAAMNPNVRLELHRTRITSQNAFEILGGYDIILDGTDNFATRYLLNDACVLLHKPLVYGSIFRFEGQVTVFDAARDPKSPCYRCFYPTPPPPELIPNCAEAGVLGVLPGIIGSLQAAEALKLILGIGQPLIGRFMLFDALAMRFSEIRIPKNKNCPVCGEHPTVTELIDYDEFCTPQSSSPSHIHELEPAELRELLATRTILLIDVREPWEHAQSHIEGSRLIPLGTLAEHTHALDASQEIVLYCASGGRSAKALHLLNERGFSNVKHLRGGIRAWFNQA